MQGLPLLLWPCSSPRRRGPFQRPRVPQARRMGCGVGVQAGGCVESSKPSKRTVSLVFERYCSIFNYPKFPDFILYQRHKMPTLSPVRELAWKVPVGLGKCSAIQSQAFALTVPLFLHLSVLWPCSQPGAGLAQWACSLRACAQVMFEVGFCMGPSGIHRP